MQASVEVNTLLVESSTSTEPYTGYLLPYLFYLGWYVVFKLVTKVKYSAITFFQWDFLIALLLTLIFSNWNQPNIERKVVFFLDFLSH